MHGLLAHALLRTSQRTPAKPGGHRQRWPPGLSCRRQVENEQEDLGGGTERGKLGGAEVESIPGMCRRSGTERGSRSHLRKKGRKDERMEG